MKHRSDLENIEDLIDRGTDDTFVFEPYDVIYLQTAGEKARDWEGDEYEGTTWCSDEINDGDTKYLLATAERVLAGELLAACERSMRLLFNLVEIGILPSEEYEATAIKEADALHQLITKAKVKMSESKETDSD